MKRFIHIIRKVAPVIGFALLFVAIKSLFDGDDTLMQYAIFGAIGGFFGGDEIGDEIAAQQQYVMGPWNQAWDDLFGEGGMQEQAIGDYQSQFQGLIDFFDTGAMQMKEEVARYQAEEMEYLGVGKQASLQRVGQQFEQLRGETTAQNIMQGLSNTSWGQQSMGALGEQQGLAEAGIETGYAQAFAETTNRQAMQMAQLDRWRIGGGTDYRAAYAGGLAQLRGNWANRRVDVEQIGAGLRGGWAERNIAHTERNVGVGMGFVGNLLGNFGF